MVKLPTNVKHYSQIANRKVENIAHYPKKLAVKQLFKAFKQLG